MRVDKDFKIYVTHTIIMIRTCINNDCFIVTRRNNSQTTAKEEFKE